MGRGCRSSGAVVAADQRLLERQQQRFVAGIEGAPPASRVAQRRRGLGVGAEHPLRVGPAGGGVEGDAVDDVAAIGGQGGAVRAPPSPPSAAWRTAPPSARAGSPRGPSAAAMRAAIASSRAKLPLDILGREFGEALGAIAALEQEGAPRLRLGERRLERVDLRAGDQRRISGELALRRGERAGIGIVGLLPRLARSASCRGTSSWHAELARGLRAAAPGWRRRPRRRRGRSAAPRRAACGLVAAPCASASA